MRKLFILCAILLFVAVCNLPNGYYTFLRILITCGAIIVLVSEMKNDVNLWGIAFLVIALLFNPFIPIYLYKKEIWMPIDLFIGLLFLIYGFKDKTKP
jgi:hypothetical protein